MHIRPFAEEDVDAVAAVLVRSWQSAYRGIVPDSHLDNLSIQARADRMREQRARGEWRSDMLLLCDGKNVVGVVSFGPYRELDLPPDTGEIGVLYLLPAYWGRGEGSRLLKEALRALRRENFQSVVLWVLKDNARARHAYERAGFAPDGAEQTIEIGGTPIPEVRYALRWDKPIAHALRMNCGSCV